MIAVTAVWELKPAWHCAKTALALLKVLEPTLEFRRMIVSLFLVDEEALRIKLIQENVARYRLLKESLSSFQILNTTINVRSEKVCSSICLNVNASKETNSWALDLSAETTRCLCLEIPTNEPKCFRGFFGTELPLLNEENEATIHIFSNVVDIGRRCSGGIH